jgi:4-hydroxy-tetrahydrodipicolinate synthase
MTSLTALRGLGVAVATPFDPAGNVDYPAFERLLAFLAGSSDASGIQASLSPVQKNFQKREAGGCDFLVILGSTGEAATIEPSERRAIVEFAVAHSHGLPVVIGTGSNSTAQSVRYTAEAVSHGADAVLVVTPFYNKPTPDGLVAHYTAVAEAAAGKPVVVYNVPGRTGLNLTPAILSRLWKIPGVVAVKESSGNLAQIGEIARTLPEGKVLLSGDDALALPSLAVGASGLISVVGNILPRHTKAMLEAAFSGNREESIRIHQALLPVMDALFLESNPIPLKAAFSLTGLGTDNLRLPLFPASLATRTSMAKALFPFLEAAV